MSVIAFCFTMVTAGHSYKAARSTCLEIINVEQIQTQLPPAAVAAVLQTSGLDPQFDAAATQAFQEQAAR